MGCHVFAGMPHLLATAGAHRWLLSTSGMKPELVPGVDRPCMVGQQPLSNCTTYGNASQMGDAPTWAAGAGWRRRRCRHLAGGGAPKGGSDRAVSRYSNTIAWQRKARSTRCRRWPSSSCRLCNSLPRVRRQPALGRYDQRGLHRACTGAAQPLRATPPSCPALH